MKKLKPGQVFNYNGLLWQIVVTTGTPCLECDLFKYCIKESVFLKRDPCYEICSGPIPIIPLSCTIKLVSKNENARRKIREDTC